MVRQSDVGEPLAARGNTERKPADRGVEDRVRTLLDKHTSRSVLFPDVCVTDGQPHPCDAQELAELALRLLDELAAALLTV